MPGTKVFRWLKMQEDFFESRRIKKMRLKENGDTMLIIYWRLQLLALNTKGLISFTDPEDSPEEELAIELGEDLENTKRTVDFLVKNNLAEFTEEGLFLPWVLKNTGSETDSARRMRKARNQLKEIQSGSEIQQSDDPLSQCDNDASQCNKNVTTEQRAKSKENRYMLAKASLDDVIDFCNRHEIPPDFGKNLFERCSQYEWKDTYGQPINNWEGYFLNAWKSENSKPVMHDAATKEEHRKWREGMARGTHTLDECVEWPPKSGEFIGRDEYARMKTNE